MRTLSVVIPALNEVHNLEHVIESVPVEDLASAGWNTEILVVDNASTDGTGDEARRCGARVVEQPERGYGNAYKAGFQHATGEVVVTGDADRTYPLDQIPELLQELERHDAEFMTTNRLRLANREAMKPSHMLGNWGLSLVSRALFGNGIIDSQSGMWMFRRRVWERLDVRSGGMQFSQELKNEAYRSGARCCEVPIEYRPRGGEVKLNALRDGWANLKQLFDHRFRRPAGAAERPHGVRLARLAQIVGILGVLALAVVAVSGAASHQAALSLTRQPARYVAVSFTDPEAASKCPATGTRLPVRFAVANELGEAADVAYDVRVARSGDTGSGRSEVSRSAGSVRVPQDEKATVSRTVRVPRRAYDVTVTLPRHDRQLVLHCEGRR